MTCDCCRYEFIKNNKFQGLTLSLIRRFALQMLVSLRYLKQEKVCALPAPRGVWVLKCCR